MLELEILPDYAGGTQGGLVHLVSLSQAGAIDTDRIGPWVARDSQRDVLHSTGSSDPGVNPRWMVQIDDVDHRHPLARVDRLPDPMLENQRSGCDAPIWAGSIL